MSIPISNAIRGHIAENVALESDPVEKTFQVYDNDTYLSDGHVHAYLEKDQPKLENGTYVLGSDAHASREGSVIQGWVNYPKEYHDNWPEQDVIGKRMSHLILPFAAVKQLFGCLSAYLGGRPDKKYIPGVRLTIRPAKGQPDYIDLIADSYGNPKPENTSNCGGLMYTWTQHSSVKHNLNYYTDVVNLQRALSFFPPLRIKGEDQFIDVYYLNPTEGFSVHPLIFSMRHNGHLIMTALQVEPDSILHTNTSNGKEGMLPGLEDYVRAKPPHVRERGGKVKNVEVDEDKYDNPEED